MRPCLRPSSPYLGHIAEEQKQKSSQNMGQTKYEDTALACAFRTYKYRYPTERPSPLNDDGRSICKVQNPCTESGDQRQRWHNHINYSLWIIHMDPVASIGKFMVAGRPSLQGRCGQILVQLLEPADECLCPPIRVHCPYNVNCCAGWWVLQ